MGSAQREVALRRAHRPSLTAAPFGQCQLSLSAYYSGLNPVTLLYSYLDRCVADLTDDDVFILSAIRTWVFAARNGRCPQAMLRSGFSARRVESALLAFLCAMTLLDQHGYGTMRFAEIRYQGISDDEARVLTLFAASRGNDPRLICIATGLVSDAMAVQLTGAAGKVAATMLPPK